MIINQASLTALYKSFNTIFNEAFMGAPTDWQKVAMRVPSMTKEEVYAWLGAFPKMREWVGDRVIQNLSLSNYSILNKEWELTLSAKRTDIEDDTIGVYTPMIAQMGVSTAEQPDELLFALFALGLTTVCYDGQYFFDTDHPVGDGTVSNYDSTTGGTKWYLLDVQRPVKPFIFQERKTTEFVALDSPQDPNVFMKNNFVYGAYRRNNVGFGLWQLAYCSKNTLSATTYEAARAAMMVYKGDTGKILGVKPNLLVVPPSLEGLGRSLLLNQFNAAGATNPWYNTAGLLVTPWLA
jgi:phage major head subunit gpT-like protein